MSYRDCEGFFCSRCLLQLRGWDILANAVKNNTSSPLSIANLTATPRYSTLPRQIAFAVTGGGGSGTYTYRWDFGDGTPASNTRNPNHNYTTADIRTATVWVSDSADPGNTVSRTLKITPPVDFTDYTASTVNAPRGTEITFRVNGATGGAGNYQYEWNFGDGDTRKRNRAQCKHTYANAGTYTVVIDVKDSEDVDNHKTENTLRVTITA
jgi:PKD repeat protein